MSISFRCPECNGVCGFHERHAGRRARCHACDAVFMIPLADGGKAKKVKVEVDRGDGGAISGFYRAALVETWGLFTNKANAAGFVLVVALVSFKFLFWNCNLILEFPFGSVYLFFGYGMGAITLGILFWYCMEIIYSTGYGDDKLPTNSMGVWADFALNLVRSLYVFIAAMTVVQLPTLVVLGVLKLYGLDCWWVLAFPISVGVFAFAMGLLIISIDGEVFSVIRVDNIVKGIRRVFGPYCVCAIPTMVAVILGFMCVGLNFKMISTNFWLVCLSAVGNLAGGIIAVIAARWIGLVFRHYGGLLPG